MAYDINKIRKDLQNASSKKRDPDEFRPATATADKELVYRFFVLPPLQEGDVLKTGKVKKSMDNFFVRYGQHWVNNQPHSCPRMWDGSDCAICNIGFKLLKECKEKNMGEAHRQAINKQWMPASYFIVNVHFTNSKVNPEELRGQTRWYRAPKTIYDKWEATILKDDSGDDEKPEAYGVFFDENSAFAFELVASKGGQYNEYKTSSFIANNGKPVPMVMDDDKNPSKEGIKQLLASRHNLWDKLEAPDSDKIKRLAASMLDGDDEEGDGFDEDETETKTIKNMKESKTISGEEIEEESTPSKKVETKAEKKTKIESKKAAEDDDDDDDDDDINSLLDQLDD